MEKKTDGFQEYRVLPEHRSHAEYTPQSPDISFFLESAVTAREENIFQGSVPPGEEENPFIKARAEKKKKKRFAFLNQLLGGAARIAAAVCVFLLLAGLIVLHETPASKSTAGEKAKEILEKAQRPVYTGHKDYGPEAFSGLWNGDPTAPHKYDWEHPVIIKAAGCTEDGEREYVCSECGIHLKETLRAAGHLPAEAVRENETAGSCRELGSAEEVVYCRVCGEELSRTKLSLAIGPHTEGEAVEENRRDASCTEDGGYDIVIYCTLCGEEISRETVVLEATGHTEGEAVAENETAATCTEEGAYERVIYCDVCGEELSRETVVLEALGHTEGEEVHENERDASCLAEGGYDLVTYCDTCGEELSRRTVTIPKTDHTRAAAVRENERAATCTAAGSYDSVVYCSVCHTELSRTRSTIAAQGHSYTLRTVAPTCTARGYTTHTCSRCGDSYTDSYTAALGHSFNNATSATCTHGCGTRAVTISYNASARGFDYVINSSFYSEAQNAGVYIAGLTVTDITENSTFSSDEFNYSTTWTIYPSSVAPQSGHQYRLQLYCGSSTRLDSNTVTVP